MQSSWLSTVIGNVADLKRLKFSDSVSEAVRRLGRICVALAESESAPKSDEETKGILAFISLHIFRHRNRIEELEVIRILAEYFSGYSGEPDHCSAVFAFLFLTSDHEDLLHKLVSASLGLRVGALLEAAGVFMEKERSSRRTVDLADSILKDYLPRLPSTLSPLPSLSPSLTYSLLLVLPLKPPSPPLLEVVLEWITSNPVTSLFPTQRPALKTSPSPIIGVGKWAILQTLNPEDNLSSELCDEIHLALLNVMSEIQQGTTSVKPLPSSLPVKQLCILAQEIESEIKNSDENVKVACYDRTGQFLQGLLSTGLVIGSTKELKSNLSRLGQTNRLISMVSKNL